MNLKNMKVSSGKNRKCPTSRRQKGIALLFTLSILSVALVTVLIFSSNAITTQKVASTFTDNAAARILADGVVDRALAALMNSEKFNFVCSHYNNFTNYLGSNSSTSGRGSSSNGTYKGTSDYLWHLEKKDLFTFNRGPLRYDSKYYDVDDFRCPSWEYVLYKDNDGKNKIFGRYAYVAISRTDRLNANALGNLHDGESDADDDSFARRLGRWTCEPQFILKKTVDKSLWDESTRVNPKKIRDAFKHSGGDGRDDGWTELEWFFNDVTGHASSGSKADQNLKLMLEQYFDLETVGDYNKFSVGGNVLDLSRVPSGDQRFRFPMIRTDWDSINVDDLLGSDPERSIPWFGAGTLDIGLRRQTAANLINYCASAARPAVTDQDWVSGEPTYTGNKRTPYINEVAGQVQCSAWLGNKVVVERLISSDPVEYRYDVHYENCSYEMMVTFHVELVNMFPSSGDYAALSVNPPTLYGTLSFELYDGANQTWNRKEVALSEDLNFDSSEASSGGYSSYTFNVVVNDMVSTSTLPDQPTPNPDDGFFEAELKVRNASLNLNRIILHTTDDQNADLALMPADLINGDGYVMISGEKQAAPDNVYGFVDVQTNDPRCNLGRNMWAINTVSESNWDNNIGKMNDKVNSGVNTDPEYTEDPGYVSESKHISTAFIRHGNMQSLWELGAIHRGEPWRTINLKCAKPDATGMGVYTDGDGHMLDHVTLQDVALFKQPDPGYINLNTSADFEGEAAPFVFKALFNNFPQTTNGDYAALDKYTGTSASNINLIEAGSIDSTTYAADKCAQQLVEAVSRVLKEYEGPIRRTSVMPGPNGKNADAFNLIIPTTGSDAQREEIFPRIVNLLKWTRQKTTEATILAIAQTIQDVGGGVSLTFEYPPELTSTASWSLHYGNSNFDGDTLITPITNAIPKNGTSTVEFGKYDLGFDHILGESKLLVRLKWDNKANNNLGAWKIVEKEYVN